MTGDRGNRLDYGSGAERSAEASAAMREIVWGLRGMGLILLSGTHLMFAMRVAGQVCPPPSRVVALAAVPLWFVPDPLAGGGAMLWQRMAGISAYLPWVVNSLVVGIGLVVGGEVLIRTMRRVRGRRAGGG